MRKSRRRFVAVFAAMMMVFTFAATAVADSPNPSSISATQNGNTVTLTGTWEWDRNQCDAVNDRYVGWEADWDDPNAPGHLVPGGVRDYFVGTPADNTIDTNGDCGAPGGPGVIGTWGPISHTYSAPGTYEICVITYDIHVGDEGKLGGHGLVAGGPNRNKDNSVEKNAFNPNQGGVDCAPITIVIPGNLTARKTVDKANAIPGDTLNYTITVQNNSNGAVNNTVVSDDISALLARGTLTGSNPAATQVGNVLSWSGQNFPIGQTRTYTFSILLNTVGWPAGPTTLPNTTVVTNSNCIQGGNDPLCSTTTIVSPNPGLQVLKTPDAQTVVAGNPVGYTINLTSNGQSAATGVTLSDPLPTIAGLGIDWTISPATAGCQITGAPPAETLSCSFGDLAPGATRSVHVTSPTTAPAGGGAIAPCSITIVNFATNLNNSVSASGTNVATSTSQTGVCVTGNPHISVTKLPDAQSVVAGNAVGFTIQVTSDGIGTANSVALTDNLPTLAGAGIDWSISPANADCSIAGALGSEVLSCNFGNLAAGQVRTVHVTSPTTAPVGGAQLAACQTTVTNFATNLNNLVQVTSSNATSATAQTGTCVQNPPRVTVTKVPDAQTVVAGSPVGFTIQVSSSGTGTANNVALTDNLPTLAGLGIDWSISPANPDCSIAGAVGAEVLSCNFGNLASGQVRSVHVQSPTTAPAGGAAIAACAITVTNFNTNLNNLVTVTSSNASSATAQTGTCVTGTPHVTVLKTPDAQTVTAGSQVGFTITVNSDGVGTANNVALSDNLPTLAGLGIDWSISPANADCSIAGALGSEVLTCNFGNLASGQTRSVHVQSATTAPAGGGNIAACQTTVTNFATNLNNSVQVTSSNAASSTAQTGTCVTGTPHITVTKVPDAQTTPAGSPVGFTIQVTSDGIGTANNVLLSDNLPTLAGLGIDWSINPANADCSIAGAVGSEVLSCNFGNLASGQVRSVHVTSPTTAPAAGIAIAPCAITVTTFATNLNNLVTVSSSNASSATAQTGTCIPSSPRIAVTKTPDAQTVTAGNTAGFTITVTSNGVGTATAVVLTDNLPGNSALGVNWSISPAVAGCSISGAAPTQTLTCNFGDLAAGQSRSVHVTSPTTAPAPGVVIAPCTITVTTFATNLNNTVQVTSQSAASATAVTGICIPGVPHITVTKTPDAQTVSAGSPVGFTMTVTSDGIGTATNVVLTDNLPTLPGLGINWTINPAVGGCVIAGAGVTQTLSCNFGDLASGQSRSVHVTSPTTAPTGGQTIAQCATTVTTFATNLNNTVQVTSQSAASATAQTGTCITINQNPHITVIKSPDAAGVVAGNPVGFTLTVNSDGTGTATNVVLTDNLPGNTGLGVNWSINPAVAGCSISGAAPTQTLSCSFGDLAQGATRSVHVTSPTTAPAAGQTIAPCAVTVTTFATNLNNSVTVTSQSAASATAQTGICITGPLAGNINVVKTANPTTLPVGGGPVVYSYSVTNTGSVPLVNVTLTDDKCAPVTRVGGDTDSDSQLDLTETWTYTCTMTVTVTTTNIATARGFFDDPTFTTTTRVGVLLGLRPVTDTDTATVVVPPPAPTGSVQIVTSPPKEPTLPPTDADLTGQNGGTGSGMVMILVLLTGIAVAIPILAIGKRRSQIR